MIVEPEDEEEERDTATAVADRCGYLAKEGDTVLVWWHRGMGADGWFKTVDTHTVTINGRGKQDERWGISGCAKRLRGMTFEIVRSETPPDRRPRPGPS